MPVVVVDVVLLILNLPVVLLLLPPLDTEVIVLLGVDASVTLEL